MNAHSSSMIECHAQSASSDLTSSSSFPPAQWSPIAIRLMQGVVYQDDNLNHWELLLRFQSPLEEYFAKIGLQLVIDTNDAMAYLRQNDDDESGNDQSSLPRLFRRTPLSYEATLLCVLLREELRQFEENDIQNERCVIAQIELLNAWQSFFPDEPDQLKINRSLTANLRKLEELKFVRSFEKEPATWEVRRILKAKLPIAELERLRQNLLAEVMKRAVRGPTTPTAEPSQTN